MERNIRAMMRMMGATLTWLDIRMLAADTLAMLDAIHGEA
jgi:hypothetical protein